MAPHGRGATPYTNCRWSTRIQILLSANHTLEYLRGKGPDDHFKKNVSATNSAGEKNKSDSHTMTTMAFINIKLASCHLLLYVVYTYQKSLTFIDAFNCYKQIWLTCSVRIGVRVRVSGTLVKLYTPSAWARSLQHIEAELCF